MIVMVDTAQAGGKGRMRIPLNLDALSARLAALPAFFSDEHLLAYAADAGAAAGWIALRPRDDGDIEVHIFLDRSAAGLPSLHVRQACSTLGAAADFLERFDPLQETWRDADQKPADDPIARVAARSRRAAVADRYADLVGEALARLPAEALH